MRKVQGGIFIGIVIIFGVLFYVTQAGYLGLNKEISSKEAISKIPDQMNFTQQQQQAQQQQAAQQAQQQAAQSVITNVSALDQYKTASATAIITTSKGEITLQLYGDVAPYTVANFIKKAKDGFYNGLTFHRVEGWVIQGGDPVGTGTGGGNIAVEFNDKPFVTGSLGSASRGDGKVQNDAQFFITKSDSSHLNGAYTNFGIVTEGMDVVNKIAIGDKITGITIKK